MKVLIAYASEQGAIIDAIVDTCRRIKLGVDLYEVSHGETALESGLYERLSSSSSVLLVISQERFSEGWVVFSVGYMLGRGDRGLLYIPFMEREIPEYFKKLSIASSQKELEYYYREEKRIWNQRIAVERAKTKLAAKGISFTEPAFIKCVERGEKTAVRCFLAAGFSPNVRNEKGVPLLSLAVRNRKKELIPMLLSAGADLNIISPDNGNSPLMDVYRERCKSKCTEQERPDSPHSGGGERVLRYSRKTHQIRSRYINQRQSWNVCYSVCASF